MKMFKVFLPGIKSNWKVVLLSVIGAATFWFFNAMNKNYDTRIDYPLRYVFDRDSVVIVSPLAETIKIDVSSGGWNLIRRTIKVSATPIDIELENPSDIKFLTRSSLTPVLSEQLSDLTLNQIITDTLFFDIEKKIQKKLAVKVDSLSIPLRENYRIITPIEHYNDSVTVTGPSSYVDQLTSHIEVKFDDDDIDSDFEEELPFEVESIVRVNPGKTVVRFDVSRFTLKEVNIPIEFLNFPPDSSVVSSQANIRIYYTINEDFENEVSASDFSVTADYNMMNLRDSTVAPILMYAHDRAVDVVLNVDKINLRFNRP